MSSHIERIMTVSKFYGLAGRDYDGPRYPAEYFRCFNDASSSKAADSRDSWLEHYWHDREKSTNLDNLIDCLVRITCFGYSKTPGRRDLRITEIKTKKTRDALASRFSDIAHAINGILLHDGTSPALAIRILHGLELPGFGRLSFGSKLLMFLNPAKFVVLDSKVATALNQRTLKCVHFTSEFADFCGRLQKRISATRKEKLGTILPRGSWPEIYGDWCTACEAEAKRWNDLPDHQGESWIASDIERVAFSVSKS
jgi:hypothetical protein